ncbi:unnamed protein product, partial [Ilex paraguariensis]
YSIMDQESKKKLLEEGGSHYLENYTPILLVEEGDNNELRGTVFDDQAVKENNGYEREIEEAKGVKFEDAGALRN